MKQEDPERGIRLLWDAQAEPTRGPKPALSLDRVVAAGIEVADTEGLGALTMRRVAEVLGFTTMSLYRYVPGKSELLDLMVDTVIGEAELAEGGWRDGLERYARGMWAVFRRHPWVSQLTGTRRTPGPRTIESMEAALAVLANIGLTAAEMNAVFLTVGYFVDSVARRLADRRDAERESGETEDSWWASRTTVFEHFTPDRFPMMNHVYLSGGFDKPLDEFEFGLARVLDGIAVFIEAEDRPHIPLANCDTE
ncbi:TetR family transcriptional regulator [Lentzea sp. NBRC 105346]|uniref:TetR/AcrR family transcriptional regulator n=1 Tax=Lentzea sp. NBRC 105346 TaxID=3032205 RepID=UPI0024A0991C|nr:TetR/AcrR family transcriptional regulator [Lentzea sp. NBRC 105346]GLZ34141.1 TetR family transcriptional regulator [Lentzea sp. NBRC 105346]